MAWLLDILDAYRLGDSSLEDVSVWILNKRKGFSVNSLYSALSHRGLDLSRSVHLEPSCSVEGDADMGGKVGSINDLGGIHS